MASLNQQQKIDLDDAIAEAFAIQEGSYEDAMITLDNWEWTAEEWRYIEKRAKQYAEEM